MKQGYIGLFRKFFEHDFWQEKRKFSKAEAWIDLLQMARWKDEPKRMLDKRGAYVLDFGDIYISERFLATRWMWSTKKVRNYLSYLLEIESISFKKRSSHRTIINIINLKAYVGWIKGERSSEEAVKKQSGSSEEAKKKKGNKGKKGNSNKTTLPKDFNISERVIRWAAEKGHNLLEEHLDYFKTKSLAKGYTYVDWDCAFMGAIRDNWAKIKDNGDWATTEQIKAEEERLKRFEESKDDI